MSALHSGDPPGGARGPGLDPASKPVAEAPTDSTSTTRKPVCTAAAAGGPGAGRAAKAGCKRLAQQIAECQKDWFLEAKEYAADPDDINVVQMGLVGLMLREGWGCVKDPIEAEKWLAEAARRGAEMPPGYKLPADLPPPAELAHLPPADAPYAPPRGTGTPSTSSSDEP